MVKGTVKRITGLLLALILAVSLVGCMKKGDGDVSPDAEIGNSKSNTSTAERTAFGLNDTAVFETATVTAVEVKESSGDEFFKPDDGNTFVAMRFSVKNTGKETITLSSLLQFSATVDNAETEYSLSAATVFDEDVDGDIDAGETEEGWYAVEVPLGWKKLEVYYQDDVLKDKKVKFVYERPQV